jgi:hypothetical protein
MRRIYAGWKRVADRVTTYPYIYANILPLPTPSTVAEEIRYFHELGLFGVQREHMARGFGWELSYWLEWQLLWDASADVRTLRRVFMDGWYGDAAGPIQRIYDRVEAVVTSVPAGQPMTERDPVRNWRGWFRGWTDSFNQLPESLLATVPANLEDLAEARRLASRPTTRAHVERDAADLAAMAAYARGRVAFDRWEAGSAGQAATLAVLSESIEEAQRWQPVSPRGTHAQIGQLRRLLAAIESETR